jgi:hypothetical protein
MDSQPLTVAKVITALRWITFKEDPNWAALLYLPPIFALAALLFQLFSIIAAMCLVYTVMYIVISVYAVMLSPREDYTQSYAFIAAVGVPVSFTWQAFHLSGVYSEYFMSAYLAFQIVGLVFWIAMLKGMIINQANDKEYQLKIQQDEEERAMIVHPGTVVKTDKAPRITPTYAALVSALYYNLNQRYRHTPALQKYATKYYIEECFGFWNRRDNEDPISQLTIKQVCASESNPCGTLAQVQHFRQYLPYITARFYGGHFGTGYEAKDEEMFISNLLHYAYPHNSWDYLVRALLAHGFPRWWIKKMPGSNMHHFAEHTDEP